MERGGRGGEGNEGGQTGTVNWASEELCRERRRRERKTEKGEMSICDFLQQTERAGHGGVWMCSVSISSCTMWKRIAAWPSKAGRHADKNAYTQIKIPSNTNQT